MFKIAGTITSTTARHNFTRKKVLAIRKDLTGVCVTYPLQHTLFMTLTSTYSKASVAATAGPSNKL